MAKQEIIDALERADGPSKEINAAIWKIANPEEYEGCWWPARAMTGQDDTKEEIDRRCTRHVRMNAPNFTGSIDAAMKTINTGVYAVETHAWPNGRCNVSLCEIRDDKNPRPFWDPRIDRHFDAEASTLPIALCVASMKARQADA